MTTAAEEGGLYAAKTTLESRLDVAAADITTPPGSDTKRLEVVLAPQHDAVPPRVTRVLAESGVRITDVSTQGRPSHVMVTGVTHDD